MNRRCPARGCGASLAFEHLMCRDCWGLLPRTLQREVNKTWRAFKNASPPDAMKARRAYLNAVKAAEDSLEGARPYA